MKNQLLSKIFILSCFLLFTFYGYSQKLKSDGFTCSIKEITKEILRTCGNNNIIFKGIIIVKSKTELSGTYPFYFANMGNNTSLFTVKNSNNDPLSPTLLFDDLSREFIYNKGKENQQKILISDEKTESEIILEGMVFWLKVKKQLSGKITESIYR